MEHLEIATDENGLVLRKIRRVASVMIKIPGLNSFFGLLHIPLPASL